MASHEHMAAYNKARVDLRKATGETIARVLGVKSPEEGELVGTGTFVRLRGKPYLLTAEHVVSRCSIYRHLVFASGQEGRPEAFTAPFTAVSAPSDLAVVSIAESQMNRSTAVDSSRFAADAGTLKGDLLFLNGYPGVKSRFSGLYGGHVSTPVGIATVEGLCNKSWFNPAIHFALEYETTNWEDESGGSVEPPDPRGMSGSLVWRANLARMSEWYASRAQAIGVVTRWVQDDKVLVGTKIEVVRSFLLRALRHEAAYYAWCDRGRPEGDALADWLEAENAITAL